jgi:hypothetical protein
VAHHEMGHALVAASLRHADAGDGGIGSRTSPHRPQSGPSSSGLAASM